MSLDSLALFFIYFKELDISKTTFIIMLLLAELRIRSFLFKNKCLLTRRFNARQTK